MTRTTCLDGGIAEFEGVGEDAGEGSGDGLAGAGAGEVAGAGWLVACGGTLRGTAPQPERISMAEHSSKSDALIGRERDLILPPQEDLQVTTDVRAFQRT